MLTGEKFDGISDQTKVGIIVLICGGYTYGQARAAVVASGLLNCSIRDLCEAKAAEADLDSGDVAEDAVYSNAATRLGVPCSVVADYMQTYGGTLDELYDEFEQALANAYEESAALEAPIGQLTPAAAGDSFTYTPEAVLSNPYSYKNTVTLLLIWPMAVMSTLQQTCPFLE